MGLVITSYFSSQSIKLVLIVLEKSLETQEQGRSSFISSVALTKFLVLTLRKKTQNN